MGQARKRGSREDRIKQAVERRTIRSLFCNDCKTEITGGIEYFNTQCIPNLDVACYATCPNCKAVTYGVHGTDEAKDFFMRFLQENEGVPAKLAAQLLLPREMPK